MTKAFVIEGTMTNNGNGGLTNVVGIAFLPDTLRTLTCRMIENMGFRPANRDRFLKFEAVMTNGGAPQEPTLYFYDRSISNGIVAVARLNPDCTRAGVTNITLDKRTASHPSKVIPAITGTAAVRLGLADAANAPGMNDFPKRSGAGFRQRRPVPAYAR